MGAAAPTETRAPPRPSGAMGAGLARNWWAVGLRGLAAAVFVVAVVTLPAPAVASLVVLFAAYLAADGVFAIIAGARATGRGARWRLLILEGAINLTVAGGVLAWPAVTMVPFLRLAAAWAVITGALLLAAARRLSGPQGHWILVLAGATSAGWGGLVATVGPSETSAPGAMGWWLIAYAVLFGVMLTALAGNLQWRHRNAPDPVASGD